MQDHVESREIKAHGMRERDGQHENNDNGKHGGLEDRRAGWAEAARQMRQRGDDRLVDPYMSTRFDREEWEWR